MPQGQPSSLSSSEPEGAILIEDILNFLRAISVILESLLRFVNHGEEVANAKSKTHLAKAKGPGHLVICPRIRTH